MSTLIRLVDKSYCLGERLGQGGMATVYRATSRLNSDKVALKLVNNEHLESAEDTTSDSFHLRLALVREFQTLSSLHHPNVVEVFGYGMDEGRYPYFTMEILEGAQDIVAAAQGKPLKDQLDLLTQLLRALAYVHRRGILHRDIKPSNVLCVGGQVKVLDFGIAVAAAHVENVAGTIEYMAPEILIGMPASVASDLYAVGILAYQMMTGSFPYSQKSSTRLLAGILHTDSDVTLSREIADLLGSYDHTLPEGAHAAEEPSQLVLTEAVGPVGLVVQRLLSVAPQDRYADAAAVVQALAAATGEPIVIETAATRESFLQSSQMLGRDSELAQLSGALDRTLVGSGSGWLLGGESGVGKSRLTAEVRTLALVSGAVVAQGQAVTEGGSHYQLWLPVLRLLCLHVELTEADAAVLKELIPDLPELLNRVIPDAPRVQPEFAEKRLFLVVESLFLKPSRPLVIFLEDLQWAGPDSLALLGRLSEAARGRPLMLVGTYRDDEYPDLPQRLSQLHLMRLQRLSQEAIAQLSASMLGEVGKQPWIVEYLTRQTEGNVFFLVEVVRAIAEQAGQFDSIDAASVPEQVFTLGMGRLVERRLEHVSADHRQVLESAATIGRKLDLPVLQQLFPAFDLRTFLMTCANAAILESGDGDWRFVHDKLREGLLDRLSPERRQQLHSEVAHGLEAVHGNLEAHAAILAYHFRQAGAFEKASLYYLRAGETATRLCAYNDARKHFAGALLSLQQLPKTEHVKRQEADTLLKQVRASHIADKPKQNLERLDQATELLKSLPPDDEAGADRLRQAWIFFWAGRLHYYRDETAESLNYYERVRHVAEEHGHKELFMPASSARGTALFAQGRVDLALPLMMSTIDTFAAMGYGYEWVRAIGHQGLCLIGLGQYERGLADLNQAHARALEIDKPIILSMTHMYYAVGSMHSGDWPFMLSSGQKCLEAARQCGEKIYQAFGLGFLAWAENQLGRPDAALKHFKDTQEIAREMGGPLLFSLLFDAVHAEILLNAGWLAEAMEYAQQVVARATAAHNYTAWGLGERVWGMALHRSDPTAATEVDGHLAASVAALSTGWLALDVARTRLGWASIYRDRRDLDQARKLLDEATLQFTLSACPYALDCAKQLALTWQLPTRQYGSLRR